MHLTQIYGEEFGILSNPDESIPGNTRSARERRDRSRSRKVSDQSSSQTSPKRKESLAKKDRIIHDDASELNLPPKTASPKENTSTADNSPVFKYIKNHVRTLFHFPMAALIKGAAILSEELFIEAIPSAWELLLETDQVIKRLWLSIYLYYVLIIKIL